MKMDRCESAQTGKWINVKMIKQRKNLKVEARMVIKYNK